MVKTLNKSNNRWTMLIVNAIILGLVSGVLGHLNNLRDRAPVLDFDSSFKTARGLAVALVVIFSIFTGLNALAIFFKY